LEISSWAAAPTDQKSFGSRQFHTFGFLWLSFIYHSSITVTVMLRADSFIEQASQDDDSFGHFVLDEGEDAPEPTPIALLDKDSAQVTPDVDSIEEAPVWQVQANGISVPCERCHKRVIFTAFQNILGRVISRNFDKQSSAAAATLGKFRVVEGNFFGQKWGEFEIVLSLGGDLRRVWRSVADVSQLMETIGLKRRRQEMPSANLSWELLSRNRRWFGATEISYLIEQRRELELVFEKLLFELDTSTHLENFMDDKIWGTACSCCTFTPVCRSLTL
jgi:hypothetical protein